MEFEFTVDDGIDETTEPVAPGTSCSHPCVEIGGVWYCPEPV